MSGGSYDYIEWKVRACADEMQRRHATEPHVVALARHLDDLAELLHRVEWADSGDTAWDDALDDDIRRFVGIGAVLDAATAQARAAHEALEAALHRAQAKPQRFVSGQQVLRHYGATGTATTGEGATDA